MEGIARYIYNQPQSPHSSGAQNTFVILIQ